jgi:hypothetical protein
VTPCGLVRTYQHVVFILALGKETVCFLETLISAAKSTLGHNLEQHRHDRVGLGNLGMLFNSQAISFKMHSSFALSGLQQGTSGKCNLCRIIIV